MKYDDVSLPFHHPFLRSPGNLDLDFPMLLSNVGEESREQHNMKERKRRYKHKGVKSCIDSKFTTKR
jgi:hypothetical protein